MVGLGNVAVSFLLLFPLTVYCWTVTSPNAESSFGNMETTYDRLTKQIISKMMLSSSNNDTTNKQYWIAIAGGAGSGKTTVAAAIRDRLNQIESPNMNMNTASSGKSDPIAVVVPMDGFHFPRSIEFITRAGRHTSKGSTMDL
jgi:pantothenate kinase